MPQVCPVGSVGARAIAPPGDAGVSGLHAVVAGRGPRGGWSCAGDVPSFPCFFLSREHMLRAVP